MSRRCGESGAKFGGYGVPAQRQFETLGHRALASGEHRCGNGKRITNGIGNPRFCSASSGVRRRHHVSVPSIEDRV
jgi:hypothetical protein